MMLVRSKLAAIGTALYLLAVVCALVYPVFDRRTFSGLVAVLLALPWIDHLPSSLLPLAVSLNAIVIYLLLAVVSLVPALVRRQRR
jgi:ABC-type Na+ efflux pump permease subunit